MVEIGPAKNWRATTTLILVWQGAASMCYYAVFASTTFFQDAFGLSQFLVGFVITSLTLGYTVLLLPTGALIDSYGERRVLIAGLTGLGLAAIAVPFSPSFLALLVVVAFLGMVYSTAIPGTNRAIFENIPEGKQHLALGIKQVGVTAGSGISAVLVTWIAGTRLGWEGGFFVAGLSAVFVTVVFASVYREETETGTVSMPNPKELFDQSDYRRLTVAGFFLGAGLFTTTGYTVLYVEESIGASVGIAGIVLAMVQVGGSAGRTVSGAAADYFPGLEQVATTRILLAQAIGSVFTFVGVVFVDSPLVALVAFTLHGFFILGFTGMYYSCMSTLIANDEMGRATAGGQLMVNGGALLGPPAFGFLVVMFNYDIAWLALAASSTVASLLLLSIERRAVD